MDLAALPVVVVPHEEYKTHLSDAAKRIGIRDADDVPLLALALALKAPLWSNDSDFEGTGVEWYTTAELLKKLGHSKPRRG